MYQITQKCKILFSYIYIFYNVSYYFELSINDNTHVDFVVLREQVVESEIEDGSDFELDDLLVAIQLKK